MLEGSLDGESMATQVLGKVNTRTRFLARQARLLTRDSLRLLANSLVLCHLDYASVAWFSGLTGSTKKKLQISQNKLVRMVMGLGPRSHVGKRQFQELNWLPVESRVTQLRLNTVHNIQNHRAPNYLQNYFNTVRETHEHNTRSSIADLKPKNSPKSKMGRSSFAYSGAQEFNELPLPIKQCVSLQPFRRNVRGWLMDRVEV